MIFLYLIFKFTLLAVSEIVLYPNFALLAFKPSRSLHPQVIKKCLHSQNQWHWTTLGMNNNQPSPVDYFSSNTPPKHQHHPILAKGLSVDRKHQPLNWLYHWVSCHHTYLHPKEIYWFCLKVPYLKRWTECTHPMSIVSYTSICNLT